MVTGHAGFIASFDGRNRFGMEGVGYSSADIRYRSVKSCEGTR